MPKAIASDFIVKIRSYRIERASRMVPRQDGQVLPDHLVKPDKQGAGHDGVANRDLVEMRQVAKDGQVVQIEIVPRIYAETETVGELGCGRIGFERGPRRGKAAL